jgi:hypothetical protein
MPGWRHSGFSTHNEVRVAAEDAEGRKKLAGYMRVSVMPSGSRRRCSRREIVGAKMRKALEARGRSSGCNSFGKQAIGFA